MSAVLVTAAALGLGLGMTPVRAAVSPYYIGLSEAFGRDSNLLRLADGAVPPEGYARSDTYYTTSLQGGIDQPFGRQRAYGSLSLRDSRFRSNTRFNNASYTAVAGLDWSTVERVSGSVLATANRGLSGFNAYEVGLLRDKNYEDTQGLTATLNVGLVTQYSLELGAGHRQVRNTLQTDALQSRNFNQDNGSLGLRWRPSGAASISLALRETRGQYPRFRPVKDSADPSLTVGYLADRYKQDTVELAATLQASGASTVDARIGNSRTRYDLNQARDFSGVTGSLGWVWQPTGKLRLASRYTRDTGQDSYAVTVFSNVPGSSDSSRLNDTLRLDANYEFSAKVTFTAGWQLLRRTIVQTVVNPLLALPSASGKDQTQDYSLGARWVPLRSLTLGCDITLERRTASGELTSPLSSNAFNCFGQFQLQQ